MPHDTSHLTNVGKLPRRNLHPASSHHQRAVLAQPVHHPNLPADRTANVPPAAGHPIPRTPALVWAGRVVGVIRKATLPRCAPNPHSVQPASNVAHLSLICASTAPSAGCISVATQLRHASAPCPLTWLPDTGSDVDAISFRHLFALGGVPADLSQDAVTVYTADGWSLSSLGKVSATLFTGSARHQTTIHLYDGLTDALPSKASLAALGYLSQGWPERVRRTAQAPPQAEVGACASSLWTSLRTYSAQKVNCRRCQSAD